MVQDAGPAAEGCASCAVVAQRAESSVVHEDQTTVVVMDLHPVAPGHLLVVPREHAVGLDDLDPATSAHVWAVAHDVARALRRSTVRCEGVDVLSANGEAAEQTVPHLHRHVIPHHAVDGWRLPADPPERARSLLDRHARAIRDALGGR